MLKIKLKNNIFRWAIFVVCVVFLGYKLAEIDNFSVFIDNFKDISTKKLLFLILSILLLPLNFFVESCKWKILLKNFYPLTLWQSVKSVLWGQTGAFITPNSLGEFPARAMNLPAEHSLTAISMGFVGSFAQTFIITLCGLLALLFDFTIGNFYFFSQKTAEILFCWGGFVMVLLAVFYIFLPKFGIFLQKSRFEKIRRFAEVLQLFTIKQSAAVFLLSFCKYLIFSTQFYLILNFFGVLLFPNDALMFMPIFYLLLTYIPLMNVFEVAVRSSVATLVFGMFAIDTIGILAASTLFWLLNFCAPTICGLFCGSTPAGNATGMKI